MAWLKCEVSNFKKKKYTELRGRFLTLAPSKQPQPLATAATAPTEHRLNVLLEDRGVPGTSRAVQADTQLLVALLHVNGDIRQDRLLLEAWRQAGNKKNSEGFSWAQRTPSPNSDSNHCVHNRHSHVKCGK